MAYSKRIATCLIGPDGKIYDEDPKGVIAVPFDSEFKIRVINKNDRKIGFDIYIDGVKVTKAGRIIVNAHDRIDLERWVENDDNGTKFRFVPKNSEEAKMEGKDKEPYTGVVEVRAYLEKEKPREIIREVHHDHFWHDHHHHHYDDWTWPRYPHIWYSVNAVGNTGCHGYSGISGYSGYSGDGGNLSFGSLSSSGGFTNSISNATCSSNVYNCSSDYTAAKSVPCHNLEEGAVVRGGRSNQSFYTTYVNLEDDYVSLKVYLMGYYKSEAEFTQSIKEKREKIDKKEKQLEFDFMKEKYCTKCGHKVNDDDSFCGKCGRKI
jgi:hypothetical protein